MEFEKRVGDVLVTSNIWDIAKEKIYFFGISNGVNDRAIEPFILNEAIKVIDVLKKKNIIPIEVKKTNDGEVYIGFYRCNNDYSIFVCESDYLKSEVLFLCHFDQKHSFYRRNKEGTVDVNADIFELLSLQELDDVLSEITIDTYNDFKILIEKIGEFESNWHVNYRKSDSFSNSIINDSKKLLNTLEQNSVLPFGVFPIVRDIKGNVAIRFGYFYNDKVYYIDVLENGYINSSVHNILGEKFNVVLYTIDEYVENFKNIGI